MSDSEDNEDPKHVELCRYLVDSALPSLCWPFTNTEVTPTYAPIVVWRVSLWARHTGSGNKTITLRQPDLYDWLQEKAEFGVDREDEFDNVAYTFVYNQTLELNLLPPTERNAMKKNATKGIAQVSYETAIAHGYYIRTDEQVLQNVSTEKLKVVQMLANICIIF
ncbi:hypothetical protein DM02DRAFT_634865 [Periconia macrospinosa]|uniref:Uncharacterized protein n=1 Tax=Periconia macrospinosa TaxID=97972 RepID=A0A2V1D4S8_9PLEO|nr:hypothetical protein DM02DRAFT_634865 [Periconia macrospinosa]